MRALVGAAQIQDNMVGKGLLYSFLALDLNEYTRGVWKPCVIVSMIYDK